MRTRLLCSFTHFYEEQPDIHVTLSGRTDSDTSNLGEEHPILSWPQGDKQPGWEAMSRNLDFLAGRRVRLTLSVSAPQEKALPQDKPAAVYMGAPMLVAEPEEVSNRHLDARLVRVVPVAPEHNPSQVVL